MTLREMLADIHTLEEDLLALNESTVFVQKSSMLRTLLVKNQRMTVGWWSLGGYLRHNTWRFFDRFYLDIVGGSLALMFGSLDLYEIPPASFFMGIGNNRFF